MAFSDPQTVTISAVANVLARVASGNGTGSFQKDDGNVALSVAHSYGKTRNRHTLRIDFSKIAPDPLISSTNIKYSSSFYIVFDQPKTGFTVAEAKAIIDGFIVWLNASSGAAITKMLGGEN